MEIDRRSQIVKNKLNSIVVATLVLLSGCKAAREESLENVAKDWATVVRASQIIAVYPLTEDLHPGDVFLVTTPIETQVDLYKTRGFLPLEQPITRLSALDYKAFYAAGYWDDRYAQIPHSSGANANGTVKGTADATVQSSANGTVQGTANEAASHPDAASHPEPASHPTIDGIPAPRAAFPSYNFAADATNGLQLALPLQGVPLGLGLMQTDKATGSATISDAYTYGVSMELALDALRKWHQDRYADDGLSIISALAHIARNSPSPVYLRVVTRVYLTGGVVVSMFNANAESGAVAGGVAPAPANVDLGQEVSGAANQSVLDAASQIFKNVNAAPPGGAVRVAQASRRSVTLSETFDRPLVVGYLGFDVPVLPTGELGVPIATINQLEARAPTVQAALTKAPPLPHKSRTVASAP
jgi:hypothetical protein